MRVIAIGEKLENSIFEIINSTKHLGCDVAFFKNNTHANIHQDDIIVIQDSLVKALPKNIKNKVISITSHPKHMKSLPNEEVINFSSLKSIGKIIEKRNKDLVVEDKASIEIFRIARKVAATNATILITGETGTGKEILAKYIHNYSLRSGEKFVAINCAAIPDTLLESELFGHEKGAFTNAIQTKIGKFEEAHRGTILLDEISEMSTTLQAKLLRVIQEREFSRLGGNGSIKTDVRIIATSNRNLQYEIQKGTFREDLFYRLNVIPIEIPNLSQRPMDITPLANAFCEKHSNSQKKLSPDVINILKNHDWKGNIRELENFIQRSVLLSPNNIIGINDIKFDISKIHINDNMKIRKTLFEIEKDAILNALEQSNGDKNIASQKLDIPVRTLRHKLKLYNQK